MINGYRQRKAIRIPVGTAIPHRVLSVMVSRNGSSRLPAIIGRPDGAQLKQRHVDSFSSPRGILIFKKQAPALCSSFTLNKQGLAPMCRRYAQATFRCKLLGIEYQKPLSGMGGPIGQLRINVLPAGWADTSSTCASTNTALAVPSFKWALDVL